MKKYFIATEERGALLGIDQMMGPIFTDDPFSVDEGCLFPNRKSAEDIIKFIQEKAIVPDMQIFELEVPDKKRFFKVEDLHAQGYERFSKNFLMASIPLSQYIN